MEQITAKLMVALWLVGPVAGCRLVMDIPDDPGTTCGNGARDPGEPCDGADLGGATCETAGFWGGALGCGDDCTLDTTSCTQTNPCGDGQIGEREDCDGADLDGQTCQGLGFHGGALACAVDCTLDRASCEAAGRCGDGLIQTVAGETCDGMNLGGQTCTGMGYYGGTLACAAGCTLHLASCAAAGRCGDDVVQASGGEECDGPDFNGMTCMDLGYCSGTLSCQSTCDFLTIGCDNNMCR